jgi:hypothetical protein
MNKGLTHRTASPPGDNDAVPEPATDWQPHWPDRRRSGPSAAALRAAIQVSRLTRETTWGPAACARASACDGLRLHRIYRSEKGSLSTSTCLYTVKNKTSPAFRVGRDYERVGTKDAARTWYEHALALNPDFQTSARCAWRAYSRLNANQQIDFLRQHERICVAL